MRPPRIRRLAGAVAVAATALAAAAPAAGEPSQAPVSGGEVAVDPYGDSWGAPDIRGIGAFTDAEGRFGVRVTLATNRLPAGSSIRIHVDADDDPSTGWQGAEVMGAVVGGVDSVRAELHGWDDGVGWYSEREESSAATLRSGPADVVWTVPAADIALARGATTRLAVVTALATHPTAGDRAPDATGAGAPRFHAGAVGVVTAPWPAASERVRPTPPAARPPLPSPLVIPSPRDPARARVLTLPGFGVRGVARGVVLTAAWRHGAGRVSWTLRLVGRRDGRRLLRVARGAGPAGPTPVIVRRTVPMPRAWRGVAFRATFTVTDGSRTITRVRMVRVRR